MRLAIYCARMSGLSGVELYTLDLALAMAGLGHSVSVHAETWGDRFERILGASGVETCDPSPTTPRPNFCITPKGDAFEWAKAAGVPIIRVIHSEHPVSDTPTPHEMQRGIVIIRESQRMLLRERPGISQLPTAMIRNPIGFHRLEGSERSTRSGGLIVSEFDEMKVALAAKFQRKIDRPVTMIGPWRCSLPLPSGCFHVDGRLDLGDAYRSAETVFSYRLSRVLPEAIYCGATVALYGGLEPEIPTCRDEDGCSDPWSTINPGQFNLAPFEPAHVARRWTDFLSGIAA